MALEIVFKRRASKQLLDIPLIDRERIEARIESYAGTPSDQRHDVVPLVGSPGSYRLRVGDWRIIFELDRDRVVITRVLHRREAYR